MDIICLKYEDKIDSMKLKYGDQLNSLIKSGTFWNIYNLNDQIESEKLI